MMNRIGSLVSGKIEIQVISIRGKDRNQLEIQFSSEGSVEETLRYRSEPGDFPRQEFGDAWKALGFELTIAGQVCKPWHLNSEGENFNPWARESKLHKLSFSQEELGIGIKDAEIRLPWELGWAVLKLPLISRANLLMNHEQAANLVDRVNREAVIYLQSLPPAEQLNFLGSFTIPTEANHG